MATAGRVAMVPKGDYNSATAYKKLDLVRYSDKAYVAKKASTGVAPTNTEYWMLLTSDGVTIDTALSDTSTNPVQNKVVKTAIDNIQTTSRATFSTAGWYRVAEYKSSIEYDRKGVNVNSCELTIKQPCSNYTSQYHKLLLMSVYGKQTITTVASKTQNDTKAFSKVRYTHDSSGAYLEVYYALDKANPARFIVDSPLDGNTYVAWQAITPTLTSETVDGVTVTTTYDIPANASPVTDLDLVRLKGSEKLTTSILEKALSLTEDGVFDYRLQLASGADGIPNYINTADNATVYRSSGYITVIIWARRTGNKGYMPIINQYSTEGWTGWRSFASTADLANYLPLDGSKNITGSLSVGTASDSDLHTMGVKNSTKSVSNFVNGAGYFYLYDHTKDSYIIQTTPNGTNTFNGTATGNLPLTGGGNVTADRREVIRVDNTNESGTGVSVGYRLKGVFAGELGIRANGNPFYANSERVEYNLLHAGNYSDYAIAKNSGSSSQTISGIATPLELNNKDGGDAWLRYQSNGAIIGSLGFTKGGTPQVLSKNGDFYSILHTGNSAKVVKDASAPTDTTSVWIDTTNKKTKAYIDGAWTVIA